YNVPSGVATVELPELGTPDPTFLNATLNELRTQQPTLLAPLPAGVTDLRFYRIFVQETVTGIHLTATSAAGTSPPTVSLAVNPTSLTAGQSSTLSWTSINATSCTGSGFTASGTSGSIIVTPSVTTIYSVTCSGNGQSASASATLTVSA